MQRGRLQQPASEGATRTDDRGHADGREEETGSHGGGATRMRERVTGGRERCAPLRVYARADDSCVSLSAASCAHLAREAIREKEQRRRTVEEQKDRRRAGG